MYLYSPNEIRIMHEERIGQFQKDRNVPAKLVKLQPMKQLRKLFKREES